MEIHLKVETISVYSFIYYTTILRLTTHLGEEGSTFDESST